METTTYFFATPQQETAARHAIAELEKMGVYKRPIVTQVELAGPFYRAGGVSPAIRCETRRRLLPYPVRQLNRRGPLRVAEKAFARHSPAGRFVVAQHPEPKFVSLSQPQGGFCIECRRFEHKRKNRPINRRRELTIIKEIPSAISRLTTVLTICNQ